MFSIFVNMHSKINSRNPQLCTSFYSYILCTSSTLGNTELQQAMLQWYHGKKYHELAHLHASLKLLHFPLHHTSLYSHPVITTSVHPNISMITFISNECLGCLAQTTNEAKQKMCPPLTKTMNLKTSQCIIEFYVIQLNNFNLTECTKSIFSL